MVSNALRPDHEMRRGLSAAARWRVSFQPPAFTACARHSLHVLVQKAVDPPPDLFPIQSKPVLGQRPDPYALVAADLSHLRGNILGLLGSAHPGLSKIAPYYFLQPSKQLRSLVVLLFSRATNGLGRNWDEKHWEAKNEVETGRSAELDRPLKHSDVLDNSHPAMLNNTASFQSVFEQQRRLLPAPPPSKHQKAIPFPVSRALLLPTQLRLAQIVEMIHIASVLHDDVCDPSSTLSFGPLDSPPGLRNKLSILGGDILIGRATTAIARLGEAEVVELMAGVISNVVEGEMLRMQGNGTQSPGLARLDGPKTIEEAWDTYLRKTYLKTASLVAKSARAAVVLGGSTDMELWKDVAYAYGRNLGMAYQVCIFLVSCPFFDLPPRGSLSRTLSTMRQEEGMSNLELPQVPPSLPGRNTQNCND